MKKLIAKITAPLRRANAIIDAAPCPSIPVARPAGGVLTQTPPIGSTIYLREPVWIMGFITMLPTVPGTVHASSLSRLTSGEMVVEWPDIGLVVHRHSDFAALEAIAS